MNYLSHYYIRHQVANPNFTLGKIIPDMLRQFGPQNKLRKAENWQQPNEEWKWMEKGAFVHLATDEQFHKSAFFNNKTALIKRRLREVLKMDKYVFFVGHVLLEFLLDRLLIKHKPDLAQTFYKQLNTVDTATISRFLRYKELKLDESRLVNNLQRFTDSRYLFHYQEDDGLVYALERVMQRVGIKVFEKSDKNQVIDMIGSLEATLEPDYLSIFNELENQIPE